MSVGTAALKTQVTGKVGDAKNPVAAFSGFLDKFKPQMALALPRHLTADRMARLAVTAFSTTPKLQACEPKSIVGAIMTAATLGLEINVDGQCFLVPYGKTCTCVPGWKGLVDLVSRSGRGTVWTGAVFEGDEFDYALGDSPFVRHKPGMEDDPKKLTHVYAIGRVNGSNWPVIEVWTMAKVWKHRDKYNKVGTNHYSFRDPEMYARKVPLLQVLKYMPKSIELQNAIQLHNAADEARNATIEGDYVTLTDPVPLEDMPTQTHQDSGAQVERHQPAAATQASPSSEYTMIFNRIKACTSVDTLDLVVDEIREMFDQGEQSKLFEFSKERRAELEAN